MGVDGAMLKHALIDTLPILAAFIILGMGFGLLMAEAGFSLLLTALMSIFIYAGSMQFVGVSLLAAGASPLTALLMTLLVNARHVFYGLSLLERYQGAGPIKPYLIFGLTDETYSLVVSKPHRDSQEQHTYYLYITLMNHVYWVTGSILGGIIGSSIAFSSKGIEFSMTALFIVIFMEQWKHASNHLPAIVGLAATLAARLMFGPDHFLIAAMAVTTAVLLLMPKHEMSQTERASHG